MLRRAWHPMEPTETGRRKGRASGTGHGHGRRLQEAGRILACMLTRHVWHRIAWLAKARRRQTTLRPRPLVVLLLLLGVVCLLCVEAWMLWRGGLMVCRRVLVLVLVLVLMMLVLVLMMLGVMVMGLLLLLLGLLLLGWRRGRRRCCGVLCLCNSSREAHSHGQQVGPRARRIHDVKTVAGAKRDWTYFELEVEACHAIHDEITRRHTYTPTHTPSLETRRQRQRRMPIHLAAAGMRPH